MGHVGIRRDNPDYYKLLVMDYVLGTGPGFTDRLSARLRDREGLAYTVHGEHHWSADLEPGVFTCYIGTDTDNFDRVKKEFLEELNRIRDTKPKPQGSGGRQEVSAGQPWPYVSRPRRRWPARCCTSIATTSASIT